MEAEHSLAVDFAPCPFSIARWFSSPGKAALRKFAALKLSSMMDDLDGDPVSMASSQFTLKCDAACAPAVTFSGRQEDREGLTCRERLEPSTPGRSPRFTASAAISERVPGPRRRL